MFPLLGEFGLLDVLVVLNYFETRKSNRQLKRANRLSLMIALIQEEDQHEIVNLLKEIKNGRKDN